MEFNDVLATRQAVRDYKDEDVTEEQLQAVLDAGKSAPVGMGEFGKFQINVVTNPIYLSFIQRAASKRFGRDEMLYGAPVFIFVSAAGDDDSMAHASAATIVENMVLEAYNQGLGACHIWGVTGALAQDPDTCEKIGLIEDQIPLGGLVVGVPYQKLEKRPMQERIEVNFFR